MIELDSNVLLVAHGLGWTLLHTIWLGAIVGLITAAGLRFGSMLSPRFRHGLCCASLVVLVILPVYLGSGMTREHFAHSRWVEHTAESILAAAATTSHGPFPEAFADDGAPVVGQQDLRAEVETAHDEMMPPWISGPAAERVGWLMALFVSSWLLVSMAFVGRIGLRWRETRRVALLGTSSASARWTSCLESLRQRMRVGRRVELLVSEHVDTPAVIGWVRPHVILPRRIHDSLADAEIEAVLAHELAHVRRQDFPANLAQVVAGCLLFYQPVAWWLLRRIEEQREFCTDDLACRFFRGTRQDYGRVLATLELDRAVQPRLMPAGSGSSLTRRIHRLLNPHGESPAHRYQRFLVAVLWLAALASIPKLATTNVPVDKSALAVMKHDLHTWRNPTTGGER